MELLRRNPRIESQYMELQNQTPQPKNETKKCKPDARQLGSLTSASEPETSDGKTDIGAIGTRNGAAKDRIETCASKP